MATAARGCTGSATSCRADVGLCNVTCRLVSTLDFGAVEYGASAQQSASFGRLAGSQLLNLTLKLLLPPTQGFSPLPCFSLETVHFLCSGSRLHPARFLRGKLDPHQRRVDRGAGSSVAQSSAMPAHCSVSGRDWMFMLCVYVHAGTLQLNSRGFLLLGALHAVRLRLSHPHRR